MRLQEVIILPFIFSSILVFSSASSISSSSIISIHRISSTSSSKVCVGTKDIDTSLSKDIDTSLSPLLHCKNNNISFHKIMIVRGGGIGGASSVDSSVANNVKKVSVDDKKWSLRGIIFKNVLGIWGVMQVVSILSNAIKRLYPIAIQPIIQQDISPYHWVMYVTWSLYMLYNEGYKAFQLKFSPLGITYYYIT